MSETPSPCTVVQSPEPLAAMCQHLESARRIAIDTEADSLHHYFEKVCLIQISAADRHFVIDPLAGLDLAPLLDLLAGKPLILHGADYDLRMLRLSYAFEPREAVFDTMLAAQLLGYPQFGLAALVARFFEVELSKAGQKWDWSRRPLEAHQVEYATNDTRYLEAVADLLAGELRERDRLEWHRETCASMVETSAHPRVREPDTEWRIKGSNRFPPPAQALLKALWNWRDRRAQAADLPAFKILNNETLLNLVLWLHEHPEEDAALFPKLPRNYHGARLAELRREAEAARRLDRSDWPRPLKAKGTFGRRDPEDEAVLEALQKARDAVAAPLETPPSILAPRAALLQIARLRPQTECDLREAGGLMRWQAALLAPALLPVLEGRERAAAGACAEAAACPEATQPDLFD